MKPWQLPSGRRRGIPFILPADWSAEQALAVIEILDDLREMICNHYQIPIHDLLQQERVSVQDDDDSATPSSDPPF